MSFVDALCDVFVKYHRDRSIVPRPKQRIFFAEDHRGEGMLPFLGGRLGTDAAREGSFNLRRRRRLDAVGRGERRRIATPSVRAGQDQGHPTVLLHGVSVVEQGGP